MNSAASAAELLAWHAQHSHSSKALRVWDLQRLHTYDMQAQPRLAPGYYSPIDACRMLLHTLHLVSDLQRLHTYDKLQQQKHAQAMLAPGELGSLLLICAAAHITLV